MSGSDPSARPWKLLIRHAGSVPTTTSSSELLREAPMPMECPVCRKPHGAQLVRPIPVEARAPTTKWAEPALESPKYYPPAVPVLADRTNGPIARSARWSLTIPAKEGGP